jgi:uncharacterized protein YjbJ (UPF0337 family)
MHIQSKPEGARAMYIGGGTVVLILVIILIVFLVRRWRVSNKWNSQGSQSFDAIEGTMSNERPSKRNGVSVGKKDKAKNMAQIAQGKIKETTGKATGDGQLESEGNVDQAEGNVKQAGEKVKDALKK